LTLTKSPSPPPLTAGGFPATRMQFKRRLRRGGGGLQFIDKFCSLNVLEIK
jgi:hypothetical protein